MALVVLEYAYEGVVSEDGGGNESLVCGVSDRTDEIVNRLVNLLGREVGRGGTGEGVKLVVLERRLLLVASPSEELAQASYGGNIER